MPTCRPVSFAYEKTKHGILVPGAAALLALNLISAVCCAQGSIDSVEPPAFEAPRTENAGSDAEIPAPPVAAAPAAELDLEQLKTDVEARLKSLVESAAPEEEKAPLRDLLQQTSAAIAAIGQHTEAAARFRADAERAPADAEKLKEQLKQPVRLAVPEANPFLSAEELNQYITQAEQALSKESNDLQLLEVEPERRVAELESIATEIATARTTAAAPPPSTATASTPQIAETRQTLHRVRVRAAERNIEALEAKQTYYQASTELIRLQRDAAARRVDALRKRLQELRDELSQRESEEADEKLDEANQLAEDAPDSLKELAQTNKQYVVDLNKLAGEFNESDAELARLKQRQADLRKELDEQREKLRQGLTAAEARLLQGKEQNLPNERDVNSEIDKHWRQRQELRSRRAEYDKRDRELIDLDEAVEASAAEFFVSDDDRDYLRDLLTRQQDHLDDLSDLVNKQISKLSELDAAQQSLRNLAKEYRALIRENVLWIRGSDALSFGDVPDAADAALWLARPDAWRGVGEALWDDVRRRPLWAVALAVVIVYTLTLRRRVAGKLAEVGQQARRKTCEQISPTFEAVFLTIALAAPAGVAAMLIGWRLSATIFASDFAQAFGAALLASASLYTGLEFVRQMCRRNGLADAHFDWPAEGLLKIRGLCRWYFLLAFLPLGLSVLYERQTTESIWHDSLGRANFVLWMAITALFLHHALTRQNAVLDEIEARQGPGLIRQTSWFWRRAPVAVALALGGLAFTGWYYAAQQLVLYLAATCAALFLLLTIRGVLKRWLLVKRRSLAMKQARDRRKAALAKAAAEAEGEEAAAVAAVAEYEEKAVDLAAVSEQTQKIVNVLFFAAAGVCLWLIWQDMLPALAILQEVSVLPGVVLGSFLAAVVTLVVTIVAMKNVPGLLEFTILSKLPIDAGARYAWTVLSRYAIAVVGLLAAGQMVELTWAKLQWLVAALSVGIGFGLQEIFANFISGLILLFERPLRIGDIITLGDTTGAVSRIQIRSTTIRDFDGKDYIVPNKDLITGRLLNWTLFDGVNRVVINVGVAYGSDVRKAKQLLRDVAQESDYITNDIEPIITFDGFGDSTLDLVLRCFLPSFENRLQAIDDLHQRINDKFNAAGIEIAFPQRDLHLRSVDDSVASVVADRLVAGEKNHR